MNPKQIALGKVTAAKSLYKSGDVKGALKLLDEAIELMEDTGFYPLLAYKLRASLEAIV